MRMRIWLVFVLLICSSGVVVAQEAQVGWDPVETQSPPDEAFLAMLIWYVCFALLVWFCLLLRKDWTVADPRTRIFGRFDRGEAFYSRSVPDPLQSALVPKRTWQEMLLFVAVVTAITFLLNHYFVQWWKEYEALALH